MVMTDVQPEGGPITGGTVAADGLDFVRQPLTDPTLNLVPQAWSPDGTRVAFEGWDDSDPTRTGVYTARVADGRDVVRLTSVEGEVHDIPSDYAPDGSRIVFYRMPDSGEWDIGGSLWVVSVDGTDEHRLEIEETTPSWWARWSPDGAKILFATARNQATGALWTVDADGSGLTKVFEDVEGRFAIQPAWSPDGTQIMFALNPIADAFTHPANGLYVVNADGTGLRLVIGDASFKSQPEWRP
jgi:Tol biopolymer transport system component